MQEATRVYLQKLIRARTSFATVVEHTVFIWLNYSMIHKIKLIKAYRLGKALIIANRLANLEIVFMFIHPSKYDNTRLGLGVKYGYVVDNRVNINMWYGKTVEELTYTCIHEACHIATSHAWHDSLWITEMKKYYPSKVITAGSLKIRQWPYGIDHSPDARQIVVLNEHKKMLDK